MTVANEVLLIFCKDLDAVPVYELSANLKTYVPAGRTRPGISTVSLKVITVCLSHPSALALDAIQAATPASSMKNPNFNR
jgi:hypothetical protein